MPVTIGDEERGAGGARRGYAHRRAEEIYTAIRDRICFLRYPPGTKLSEQKLADEFEVSRTPIRRVLQRLEFEHLAERRQGAHTVVTGFDFDSLRDVYVIRMILAESSDCLSPPDGWWRRVDALRRLRRECRALKGVADVERLGMLHLALQEELAGIVGNQRAREIMMQLYFQIARIWLYLIPSMSWDEEVCCVVREIDALIEAMEHRDIRAVGLIRRNHIAMNIERMRRALDTSGTITA